MALYTIYSIYICKQLICLNVATIKICISLATSCGKCVELTRKKTEREREESGDRRQQQLGKIYKFMLDILRCCGTSIYMGNWPKCWPTLTHLCALSLRQRLRLRLCTPSPSPSPTSSVFWGFVGHIKVTWVPFDLQFVQLQLPNLVSFTCSVRNLCHLGYTTSLASCRAEEEGRELWAGVAAASFSRQT